MDRYGLGMLRAATSDGNVASQQVLFKAGFVPVSPAEPSELGGKSVTWYERYLTGAPGDSGVSISGSGTSGRG